MDRRIKHKITSKIINREALKIMVKINKDLTRFVFKSIITPLDTLVYGVHQIRDGNLNYHIEYEGKDEFTGVCSDFKKEKIMTRGKEILAVYV